MRKETSVFSQSHISTWGAYAAALFALITYILQAINFAQSQDSILDEGAYLIKGYLFLTGQYSPYQAYGPWTNKMPLSFLIPGTAQYIFGPGLDTGRYFAIFLAVLALVGLWIVVRRFGGNWWAAAVLWFFALNPGIIKTYSLAVSQVLIACMLVWMLVLVIGKDRKVWQIALGAFLAGLIIMTRINMFLILPLSILYIYWLHDWRKAGLFTVCSVIPLVVGHAVYWPEILHRYAVLFPRGMTPFLNQWRTPQAYSSLWNPIINMQQRFLSLLQTARTDFSAIFGALIAWMLWPPRKNWRSEDDFRTAVYLSAMFICLFLFHLWAALGNNFCVYCLSSYFAFFSFIGLLLIVITSSQWRKQMPSWLQIGLVVIVIAIAAAAGYGAFPILGDQLLDLRVPESLSGFPELELIKLKKLLRVELYYSDATSRRLVPTLLGVAVGLIILISAFVAKKIFTKIKPSAQTNSITKPPGYGYWLVITFLVIGTVLTPTVDLITTQNSSECDANYLSTYREVGEHLAAHIPPGAKVYWKGGESFAPLLYVPGINLYPAQINGAYSYKMGGYRDTDPLLRLGYWNSVLDYQWLHAADIVLVQDRLLNWSLEHYLVYSGEFEELESTPPLVPCDGDTRIRIFRRIS